MLINEKIIEHAQEKIRSEGTNLVRMESESMDAFNRQNYKELKKLLPYKITPTDFTLAAKLDEITKKLALNWENLEDSRKKLFTNLALSEPKEEYLPKAEAANAIYDKVGESGFWQNSWSEEEDQALSEIAKTAHALQSWKNLSDIKAALNAQELQILWMGVSGLQTLNTINRVFRKYNLLRQNLNDQNFGNVASLPSEVSEQSVSAPIQGNWEVENVEEVRIKEMLRMEKPEVNLSKTIEIPKSKQKPNDQIIKEAYSQAEEEESKHLWEQLNQVWAEAERKKQKRFKKKEPEKITKTFYAANKWKLLAGFGNAFAAGAAVGGAILASWGDKAVS